MWKWLNPWRELRQARETIGDLEAECDALDREARDARRKEEMMDWTSPAAYRQEAEWRPLLVLSSYGYGYPSGFDRNRVYEFRRDGSEEVQTYRLADLSPYANVAGLYWREVS